MMGQLYLLPFYTQLDQGGDYALAMRPQRRFVPQRLVVNSERAHECTITQIEVANRALLACDAPSEMFSPLAIGTRLTGAGECDAGQVITLRFRWHPKQQRQPFYVPRRRITRTPLDHWLRHAWWVTTEPRSFHAVLVGGTP